MGEVKTVCLEKEARFPWSGGTHPRLDVLVETSIAVVGIEAKWYEPFDKQEPASFTHAYWRSVWGDHMGPFEKLRDQLTERKWEPVHLNAGQLVKHGFGLRTRAARLGKSPLLLYVYAQPNSWPDGTPIPEEYHSGHAGETKSFASETSGSEVKFLTYTFGQLISQMRSSTVHKMQKHADMIVSKYVF
jgi:hypothetical protein